MKALVMVCIAIGIVSIGIEIALVCLGFDKAIVALPLITALVSWSVCHIACEIGARNEKKNSRENGTFAENAESAENPRADRDKRD